MKTAWLITWEWMGDHAAVADKVVAVVSHRRQGAYVKDLMEQLYVSRNFSDAEKLAYAKDRSVNPYPASFDVINGVPWQGRITCGDNPFLLGRMVSNLRLEEEDGEERLHWHERPIPEFNPS
ncbi:hypothetical protein [Pseudomonas sp. Teo4]|uniref:hypothetical protein n=1 Tax=Pseudomonas sp. Teo4 TaxID=3064528 RepID=UPI002ABA7111|nr:hypothetical protein [Pseudomonas sp. Teo4]MDZ3993088.1 hypothetical protein [Pseudomonas sp. Teo4]